MTYILAWFLCSICSFYLFKNYVESNLRSLPSPPENIAQAMRNAAKRDDSIDEIYNASDNVICSLFWTVILVVHICIWPICLVQLTVWQTIDKQDFSDFRGV